MRRTRRQVHEGVGREPVQEIEGVLADAAEASEGALDEGDAFRQGIVLPGDGRRMPGAARQTPKEVPQPQLVLAFGLLKTKPLPLRPPEYSRIVPARKT